MTSCRWFKGRLHYGENRSKLVRFKEQNIFLKTDRTHAAIWEQELPADLSYF